jgi:hypothetical protein
VTGAAFVWAAIGLQVTDRPWFRRPAWWGRLTAVRSIALIVGV